MMYAVADGDAAATRRHTKGEAVTNGTQKARRRRIGEVAANGDSQTNNNQSHFKVPS